MRRLTSSLCSLSLGVSALCNSAVAGSGATPSEGLLYRSTDVAGSYFAVAIRSKSVPATTTRHIVLVDTSASQTGRFRTDSAELLKSVLSGLPAGHTVRVVAADSSVEFLTSGFVPTGSSESFAAVDALLVRTPMGATDLNAVVTSIVQELPAVPVSLLYIGDGMSSADQLNLDELKSLSTNLIAHEVAFHACLLGPQLDTELVSILANQTGGIVTNGELVAEDSRPSDIVSALMQTPVRIAQLHPTDASITLADDGEVVLRSDRDTVVFGKSTSVTPIELAGRDEAGEPVRWTVSADKSLAAGSELRVLFDRSAATSGLTNSVVGSEALASVTTAFQRTVDQSIESARALQKQGRPVQALEVARSALLLDAGNPVLTSLVKSLADETIAGSADDKLGPPTAGGDDPLRKTQARDAIRTQQLVQVTNAAIEEARRVAPEQPDFALTLLKDVLDTIRSAPELAPENRSELERRISGAYESVLAERQSLAIRTQEAAQQKATEEAQKNLLTETALDDERLKTQIATVRGLLERARKGDIYAFEEAEAAARIALDMKPGDGTATAAVVVAEAAGQLSKAYRLVNLRHDRFLETLYQVELSHVPFPDEPPVQYPAPEVWRALTINRKKRYKSVALRSEKPVEIWLEEMLDQPIPELNYPGEESLENILKYIEDYYTDLGPHTMRILPDRSDVDITEDFLSSTSISNIDLKGITLRNALKLMFAKVEEPELTYLIKNEVMLITTRATAESEENLVTRIYDVADLVVITQAQAGGGQGGQGGQGGGGQGGGGFGGGGQGGGGQGGGGFGGGGAAFSISDDIPAAVGDGVNLKGSSAFKKKPGK